MPDGLDHNDQIVDPPLTGEDMDAFIASLESDFNYQNNINLSTLLPQGNNDEGGDDDDTDENDDQESNEGEETPDTNDFFTINGKQFSREEIERLYNFDQYLRANPDAATRVAQAITRPSPVSETPPQTPPQEFSAPEPPSELDLDDPQTKILWDQVVESRKAIWDQNQRFAQQQQTIAAGQQRLQASQAQSDMQTALNQFKEQFINLNEDDITTIRKEAGPILPSFLSQLPPVTALFRSMEVAAWANADIRKKLNDPEFKTETQATKSTTRKRKLGSISGSPASAPKTETRPQYRNDRDMVNQLAQAFQDSLGR